jgi:hypothetical protein
MQEIHFVEINYLITQLPNKLITKLPNNPITQIKMQPFITNLHQKSRDRKYS